MMTYNCVKSGIFITVAAESISNLIVVICSSDLVANFVFEIESHVRTILFDHLMQANRCKRH